MGGAAGKHEELRRDAADVAAVLGTALGPDFAIFLPLLRKTMAKHRMQHAKFEAVAARVLARTPFIAGEAGGAGSEWGPLMLEMRDSERSSVHESVATGPVKLQVNELNLRKAWESSQRSTKEDWEEWMRNLSVELLKESPSPALRACHSLAQLQPHVARELFAAGFVSCWSELHDTYQEQLVRSLEAAFASPTIPPEIIATLLNLAEFMEHDEKPLPVDIRTLGALAEKCHAYAKALHYKETEFQQNPAGTVEALISINNQLHQPEAAVGILVYAQQHLQMELKESWYEKLQRWDDALEAYQRKYRSTEAGSLAAVGLALGQMRCLAALAEWEQLSALCREMWPAADSPTRSQMAAHAAHAAWNMGQWQEMETYITALDGYLPPAVAGTAGAALPGYQGPTTADSGKSLGAFFQAALCVHHGQVADARQHVARARTLLGTELTALVGESYERAYTSMVRVQQLTELEEVVEYSLLSREEDQGAAQAKSSLMRTMWRERIHGVQSNVEVWQGLLSVRSLVLPMADEAETWIKFASLCQKSGRERHSHRTLLQLLKYDPATRTESSMPGYGAGSGAPHVMLAYLKHQWASNDTALRRDALARLQSLICELQASGNSIPGYDPLQSSQLASRAFLKLGIWQWALCEDVNETAIEECLQSVRAATEFGRSWGKAWHHWALFNVAAMEHYARNSPAHAIRRVAPAVSGFFRSIALDGGSGERRGGCLQDILRLLTLWFNHGGAPEVEAALNEGFAHVSIDTWLVVIPQIIARIHSPSMPVRHLIHNLLVRVGRHHPQALLYPLLVACKSQSSGRRAAAMSVVDNLRQHSQQLVEQAQLVSQELIRVAILWHEMWHEGLEEASRLYFGEQNVEGMLGVLAPLHQLMDRPEGAQTLQEISFVQAYGRELQEANDWCQKYRRSGREAELNQAWDLYYHVFKRINKQLPSLTTLDLGYVSPLLVSARGLELAVPGTYSAGQPLVTIQSFAPHLHVITSKQRPRKLTINGGDGQTYGFLLKGHEDLRQDERVMQLFTLVNTLLANNRETAERDLSIARYAVVPLSPNSGLIGWVPNCDTLHALIREHREARKVPLNLEHRLMLTCAPDYDHLTLIAKVEVFEHAVENTPGDDLHKVLWLKSKSSEVWLNRRTNYTRSLAVMSMVGYLLGLGDRHPSNLMLDRASGKMLHIDFGDCFEASMNREKYPEKVPFRLTRMLVKAMEVSGIEGNFRSTCCSVMHVLRSNKDSVMAMLEAFVHDPLINWRLLNTAAQGGPEAAQRANPDAAGPPTGAVREEESAAGAPGAGGAGGTAAGTGGAAGAGGAGGGAAGAGEPSGRGARERELLHAVGQLGDASEVLNERAVAVMKRMSHKLTGRDFIAPGAPGSGATTGTPINSPGPPPEATASDSVEAQVQRLITQATSHENLCQSYIGWCPFW
ncbi:hypothetical protein CYMTET_25476 [Cymbomonas tetramitiformis]|uniref:non-specific serine/threonine protein kinase n=1 Tax=Cymbomonas tetramitiformis TaxID=36881 RepID=A0AAE0FUF8_9CHLO|nr:hypothetical protein CYMTET_25476 [Cymbomonas tetramitiformis]